MIIILRIMVVLGLTPGMLGTLISAGYSLTGVTPTWSLFLLGGGFGVMILCILALAISAVFEKH